jgi:hypothetical protein
MDEKMNENTRCHWLNKLRKLNPNRSKVKGAAPHKPCLLLSLLDMAQDGELQEPTLQRTPSLHVRFNAFSSIALPHWGVGVDLGYAHITAEVKAELPQVRASITWAKQI